MLICLQPRIPPDFALSTLVVSKDSQPGVSKADDVKGDTHQAYRFVAISTVQFCSHKAGGNADGIRSRPAERIAKYER